MIELLVSTNPPSLGVDEDVGLPIGHAVRRLGGYAC